jgi:deoxyribodipyrimidine photo-lyase
MSEGTGADAASVTSPLASEIPTPEAVCDRESATGYVVWHRKHLRTADHLALARAVDEGDVVCPLFVFDPSFYAERGLACDTRVRLLHEAIASLDRLYAAAPTRTVARPGERSRDRLAAATPLEPEVSGDVSGSSAGTHLGGAGSPGLALGYGDPVELLARYVDRGWSVLTMATPTSRYGQRRDARARDACGDAVEFVSGDGLVRGREWSRTDWQSHVERWLDASQHTPGWDEHSVFRLTFENGVSPAVVDDAFDITPRKTKVPTGTHRAATTQMRSFVDRLSAYPQNISAPQDARDGTSGLSPYLNFGLLSVRQVHQYVTEHAPSGRGLKMFTDRLVWNMHYNQKLVDWPGWTERAVNPVFEALNADRHEPELVTAWKRGETGFPMVDAAMRCLQQTGWLNFRMRAMCASFFTHVLHQPWWIGADWYHHHLVDSDVGINYTQWQSQAGLIGKPSQRVYNPRKQVRDHDPEGEWITEWVPELAALPSQFLDRPERTPLGVQAECGVTIGEDYPRPVVEFEARRESFWSRYERLRPEAARQLARPAIAKRASFSGGYDAAKAIAAEYGRDPDVDGSDTQLSLAESADEDAGSPEMDTTASTTEGADTLEEAAPSRGALAATGQDEPQARADADTAVPTGAGERAGEPSPDDRAAAHDGSTHRGDDRGDRRESAEDDDSTTRPDGDQTTIHRFD